MKKQILILIFALTGFMVSAIGDSCSVAIPMPYSANSGINGSFLAGGQMWFAFVPLTSEVDIKLTNANPANGHVHDLLLLEGLCNPKYWIIGNDSRNDSVLKIHVHGLVPGLPYHILTMRERTSCTKCTAPGALFDLNVKSLPPPVETVSNGIVYLNGQPSHVKGEVVIRISKTYLKLPAINNVGIQSGGLNVFVQNGAVIQNILSQVFNILDVEDPAINKIILKKVYPKLKSTDTISISRLGQQIRIPEFWETFILKIPDTMNIYRMSRVLSDINGIRHAEPNFVYTIDNVPNDSFYSTFQSNLHSTGSWANANINVEGAWDIETGKPFVKVGVYDTGIDATHSDLGGGKVAGGYDYFNNTTNIPANDGNGHGTNVAGVIGALRNNNNQIAGIAGGDVAASNTGCSLYDMKVVAPTGNLIVLSTIANAIFDGATGSPSGQGLHIMNCSWTSDNSSTTLHDNIQYADQNGVSFVASRGNFPQKMPLDKVLYPSCYQDEMVMSVGASGSNGDWKTTTNGNVSDPGDANFQSIIKNDVDFIAPGTNTVVRTTQANTNSFVGFDGTSAAAPHVSGMAALMLSHVKQPTSVLSNLAIEDVENILQLSAVDKFTPGFDDHTGWGLINGFGAMNGVKSSLYKIQHFGVGQNASHTISQALIGSNVQIVLVNNYQALAAGVYYGDKYEVTITLNYSLSNPNDQIINSWPRFSSTFGWSGANPQSCDNYCQVVSVTNTQAVLKTWIYNITKDQMGQVITDPWYPTQYFPKVALSIYTANKTTTGVNEFNSNGSQLFTMYPNPANNNVTVNLALTSAQNITLGVYDVQGNY